MNSNPTIITDSQSTITVLLNFRKFDSSFKDVA